MPYNSFNAVNIQGGGANFNQALQQGEVDAIVTWEPFESIPVMKGYGFFAKNLDYSRVESRSAPNSACSWRPRPPSTDKREAVERFVWAYVKTHEGARGHRPPQFAHRHRQADRPRRRRRRRRSPR